MRTEKFILFSILLLVFLISNVSAGKTVYLDVIVKNSTSPNSPISGARVIVTRATSSDLWDLTTDSQGRTPDIVKNLPYGTHDFYINVTAPGFQQKTNIHSQITLVLGDPTVEFTLATVLLDSESSGPTCNNNGTCDTARGETTANCPADCPAPPLASGIVKDVQLIIPPSGQTDVQCPTGYATGGSFYDPVFNALHKLCVQYSDLQGFVPGSQYVNKTYLKAKLGEHYCDEGDIALRSFSGGGVYYTLCISKVSIVSITSLSDNQYVSKVNISAIGSCTSEFNRETPENPFSDASGGLHKLCVALQNPKDTTGPSTTCTLSTPQWVNSTLDPQQEVWGWIGTDKTNYIHGIKDLFLYVNATGCREDVVKFEIYEGPFNDPSSGEKRYTFSPASWQDGYKFYPWQYPEWFEKAGPGSAGPRYYVFKAIVDGSSNPVIASSFSSVLTVKRPLDAECHYDPSDDADDKECVDAGKIGHICVEDNTCQNFACDPNNRQSCSNGYCDPTTLKCVECLENSHCTTCTGPHCGTNWVCDLTSTSSNFHKCIYNQACHMTVKWARTNDNGFDPTNGGNAWPGKVTSDSSSWQCGTKFNLVAESLGGCDEVADIVFVLAEKNLMISDTPETFLTPQTRIAGSRYLVYSDFEPTFSMTLEDLLRSIPDSLIGAGNVYQYYFFAADKSRIDALALDPSKILNALGDPSNQDSILSEVRLSDDSAVLMIKKPAQAECNSGATDKQAEDAKCGTGKVCAPTCNKCDNQCTQNSDCKDGKVCAIEKENVVGGMIGAAVGAEILFTPVAGAIKGRCYECFNDIQCVNKEGKKHCALSGPNQFTCVECTAADQCTKPNNQTAMLCGADNKCTATCNTNADCTIFKYLESTTNLNKQQKIDLKGKEVCDTESHLCVQCTDNYDPKNPSGTCQPGETCCWEGIACLEEENKCVECIEDSICGWGSHCNTEEHKCEAGFPPKENSPITGIIMAIIGVLLGMMFMGPCGALFGGLIGLLLGGGLGGGGGEGILGGLGGLLGNLGGLGGLFGTILNSLF
jgi:hypothetical protein